MGKQADLYWLRTTTLDRHAQSKLAHGLIPWNSLDLRPISAGMTKLGITQAMLQFAIVGQQEQPFAIVVEPACRIDISHLDIMSKRIRLAGKLAHHPEWLVEQNVAKPHVSSLKVSTIAILIYKRWIHFFLARMNPPEEPDYSKAPKTPQRGIGYSAFLVAAGIFSSKIAGLVRERIFAYYFGNSAITDAFRQAMRIPNFLQNLFGEGVLSASFIPVYAKLVAQDEREEAGRVAGAIFSILALLTAALVLLGVVATPYFIDVIAPGFKGETRRLTIQLVRIIFPGVGLLVLSAWCLGILNSHGKFLLSYASPVVWNAAFVGVLIVFGRR